MIHADKIAFLTGGIDLAARQGLEIGARDAPLIHKQNHDIAYADYADAETIRANLDGTGIDPARVVEIDIVTQGGKLSNATTRRFDYILASHVAEHVPDLLGWLIDLQTLLRPGGTLGLAIPDRRFTFDRLRADSTIAEALEAWVLGYERPSLRQIIDSAWQAIEISPQQGWNAELPPESVLAQRQNRLPALLVWARQAQEEGRYIDAHCWVFTAGSFLALAEQAALLGLFPFVLDGFHPAAPGGYEFLARLRRAEAGETAEIAAALARARAELAVHPSEAALLAAVQKEDCSFSKKRTKKLLNFKHDSPDSHAKTRKSFFASFFSKKEDSL